jgi:hypothetical protein
MPLTLDPTSYTFLVQLPGVPASSDTIVLQAAATDWQSTNPPSIPVSLEITGPSAGFFTAELHETNEILTGLGQSSPPHLVASTSGNPGPSGNITNPPGTHNTFSIALTFTGPTQPVPGYFTATLGVTGAGATATMTLVATTAQITATANVVGVDGFWQLAPDANGACPFVIVLIDCAYGDPNPLKLQVALESQSPPNDVLRISSPPPISVPQPLEKVVNPRMPQWDFWWPLPDRVGKVTVNALIVNVVKAVESRAGKVSFNVSTPDFPWLTNPPITIEVPFGFPNLF